MKVLPQEADWQRSTGARERVSGPLAMDRSARSTWYIPTKAPYVLVGAPVCKLAYLQLSGGGFLEGAPSNSSYGVNT